MSRIGNVLGFGYNEMLDMEISHFIDFFEEAKKIHKECVCGQ
jgi:hypothetical protein